MLGGENRPLLMGWFLTLLASLLTFGSGTAALLTGRRWRDHPGWLRRVLVIIFTPVMMIAVFIISMRVSRAIGEYSKERARGAESSLAERAAPESPTYLIGNTRIAIPAPGDDLIASDDLIPDMSALLPDNVRLVAAFAMEDEIEMQLRGELDPGLTRWGTIQVVRVIEPLKCSESDFAMLVDETESAMQSLGDVAVNDEVSISDFRYDRKFFRAKDCVGFGFQSRVGLSGGDSHPVIGATVCIRAKERFITANLYASPDESGLIDARRWVYTEAERWGRRIVAENGG